MNNKLTGEQIKELFYDIVDDDELSDDTVYKLMNSADTQLANERDWMWLRAKDTSIQHTTSQNYQTGHDLPEKFKKDRNVYVMSATGTPQEVFPVPYDQIETYRDEPRRYAVDYANNKIYFTGIYQNDMTVILNYVKYAETLEDDVEAVWPDGAILAFKMAKNYSGGMDGDEVNFRMSPEQENEFAEIRRTTILLDGQLQARSMGNQLGINPRVN